MAGNPAKMRQHQELTVVKAISKTIDARYPPPARESSLIPKPEDKEEYRRLLENYIRGSSASSSTGPGSERSECGSVGGGENGSRAGNSSVGSENFPTADSASASPEFPEGVTWGNVGEVLTKFLSSEFGDVRRLAASALGKLAPSRPACQMFLPVLEQLAREDPKPQVRQYAVKAIGRYTHHAIRCLDALKDVARDGSAPEYVRTAAAEVVAAIQSDNRSACARRDHFCSRCKRRISEDEYFRGMRRWGKPYCRHCHDEKQLEDRNFEATVEDAKRLRSELGVAVQSRGEKMIADFLEREGIAYEYDERFMIAADTRIRPDFYLPEFDVYIEYFGMDTPEYRDNMLKKRLLYQRAGKKLVSASYKDADPVAVLRQKLSRYFRI